MNIYTQSGNFPRDLWGEVDTRPYTWGRAEAQTLPLKFSPPAGYLVRILKLRGNLTSMPTQGKPNTAGVENLTLNLDGYAGVLVGFSTSSTSGSAVCDYAASGCFLYLQDCLSGFLSTSRISYDYDYSDEECLLDSDHILNLKIAAFLNTLEVPVHVEAAYSITFTWVKAPPND